MTINEYKKKFLALVKEMEEEHSCTVGSLEIETIKGEEFPFFERKNFKLTII